MPWAIGGDDAKHFVYLSRPTFRLTELVAVCIAASAGPTPARAVGAMSPGG
jgi:hypothetical protein